MVKAGDGGRARSAGMVRWLVGARKDGRWGNTQENALAMQALVELLPPLREHDAELHGDHPPRGRGTRARASSRGDRRVGRPRRSAGAALGAPAAESDAHVQPEGEGTLFYATRLSYARDSTRSDGLDDGFHVERRYAVLTDGRAGAPTTSFKAGDLVQVTVSLNLPKERRYVAVTDPLPAGFEAVECWFATTRASRRRSRTRRRSGCGGAGRGRLAVDLVAAAAFDHVERHDDRVLLFATRLSEGRHEFTYVVRATTAGTFKVRRRRRPRRCIRRRSSAARRRVSMEVTP